MNYDEAKKQENNNEEAKMEFERIKQKPQYINSHADLFKYVAIAIAIIGVIAGIICGASIPSVAFDYRSFGAESGFNVALMFTVWAGTAITVLAMWAVYCVLDTLDNLLLEAKRVKSYIEFKIDKENQ